MRGKEFAYYCRTQKKGIYGRNGVSWDIEEVLMVSREDTGLSTPISAEDTVVGAGL